MKNAEVNFSSDPENPGILNVEFSGELTITNATAFKELIVQKLKHKDGLNITSVNVDELDLSFYQLLVAIKKSCEEKNKQYSQNLNLPAEEEELLMQAGFDNDLT
jgi:anti-anti-sigma regulatory factor